MYKLTVTPKRVYQIKATLFVIGWVAFVMWAGSR